ncbi:unnamed protein product [Pieris macdunnoughi]|uniref:Gag-like protein n=1 Tax=Pieris macdunnoughi TaxID=345717 RepID=A0A821WSD4_9NEOP|nr:unnamed protein product [Pieris macdunnoughi]
MEMAKEYRQTGLQALSASRNIKGELKAAITEAIEGLFGVVGLIDPPSTIRTTPPVPTPLTPQADKSTTPTTTTPKSSTLAICTTQTQLVHKIEAHSRLLEESNRVLQEHTRALKACPTPAPTEIQQVVADPYKIHQSYAKAAATPKPPAGPSVVVSGEGLNTAEQLLTQISRTVDFRQGGYAPLKVTPLSKHKIKLVFEKDEHKQHTLTQLQKNTNIKTQEEKRIDPMIILKGINKLIPETELTKTIKDQNPTLTDHTFSIKFTSKNRNSTLYNIVLNTTPSAWKAFADLGRVNIGMQRVHSDNFSPFRQCQNCLNFGHTKSRCPNTTPTCAKCSAHHPTAECKAEVHNCTNCAEHNKQFNTNTGTLHRADSEKCPKVRAMRARVEAKINYT